MRFARYLKVIQTSEEGIISIHWLQLSRLFSVCLLRILFTNFGHPHQANGEYSLFNNEIHCLKKLLFILKSFVFSHQSQTYTLLISTVDLIWNKSSIGQTVNSNEIMIHVS